MTSAELLELMRGTTARRWVPRTARQLEAWVLQQREFRAEYLAGKRFMASDEHGSAST
jgi:hypothetical protein